MQPRNRRARAIAIAQTATERASVIMAATLVTGMVIAGIVFLIQANA